MYRSPRSQPAATLLDPPQPRSTPVSQRQPAFERPTRLHLPLVPLPLPDLPHQRLLPPSSSPVPQKHPYHPPRRREATWQCPPPPIQGPLMPPWRDQRRVLPNDWQRLGPAPQPQLAGAPASIQSPVVSPNPAVLQDRQHPPSPLVSQLAELANFASKTLNSHFVGPPLGPLVVLVPHSTPCLSRYPQPPPTLVAEVGALLDQRLALELPVMGGMTPPMSAPVDSGSALAQAPSRPPSTRDQRPWQASHLQPVLSCPYGPTPTPDPWHAAPLPPSRHGRGSHGVDRIRDGRVAQEVALNEQPRPQYPTPSSPPHESSRPSQMRVPQPNPSPPLPP
mmetsp:Transcript_15428/g.36846  ORF Transcript_15428/g.36846 Transcript_15428/m.36846 type:complete len:335 (+) Transcript_15428:111-1115(+)